MADSKEWALGVPSHADKLECDIVGNVLFEGGRFGEVSSLHHEMFYSGSNGALFEAMSALALATSVINRSTVHQWLVDRRNANAFALERTIDELHRSTPRLSNLSTHVAEVRARHQRRRLRELCIEYAGRTKDLERSPYDIGAALVEAVGLLADKGTADTMRDIDEVSRRFFQSLRSRGQPGCGDIQVGLPSLDKVTGGVRVTEFVAIGGRPGTGKTTALLQIGQNLRAQEPNAGIVYLSLEMACEELAGRIYANMANVPMFAFERFKSLDGNQLASIDAAAKALKGTPTLIDDASKLSIAQMRARLRVASTRLAKRGSPLRLVLVDYIQLIEAGGPASMARYIQVQEVTRALKDFAKEFQCVVIAGAQLGRGVDQDPSRAPRLSDFRESASIEADADQCWLLDGRTASGSSDKDPLKVMNIVIAKNRRGPLMTVPVAWEREVARFREPTERERRRAPSLAE